MGTFLFILLACSPFIFMIALTHYYRQVPISNPKPEELFKGVEKPTVTLAKMLVAEMLQNLDAKKDYKVEKTDFSEYGISTIRFPSFVLRKKQWLHLVHCYTDTWVPVGVEFCEEGKRVFKEGVETFFKLRKKKQLHDAETKKQHDAVDFIANMMGVKNETE